MIERDTLNKRCARMLSGKAKSLHQRISGSNHQFRHHHSKAKDSSAFEHYRHCRNQTLK
jgi:hypothetical protein